MTSLSYLTLITAQITTLQSLSCTTETSIDCNIDCHQDQICWNQILNCSTDLDCHVGCNGFGNRRRLKHEIQTYTHRNLLSTNQCADNDGCCGSTIYCPANKKCSIDCSEGCNDITIHAEHSNYLSISNCRTKHQEQQDFCTNMTVFCPENIHRETLINNPMCIIDGPVIRSTNIYTKQGFNDLQLTGHGTGATAIIDTQVYCGTSANYKCEVNENGNGCSNNHMCNNLILTTNPTVSPGVSTANSTVSTTTNKLTFYPTVRPTVTIINEGSIGTIVTTNHDTNKQYVEENQSSSLSVYGIDLEIVILSAVCFLLLICCMLFCTLWMDKMDKSSNKKDINKVNNMDKINDCNMRSHIDVPLPQEKSNKPKIPSVNMDNLSVLSVSNFPSSVSIRNTYSTGGIISPRTQSAIMSICAGNSGNITDWEDGITVEDVDIAFDDVITTTTYGENPHIKDDEFVIVDDEDNDEYFETPGDQMAVNNNV